MTKLIQNEGEDYEGVSIEDMGEFHGTAKLRPGCDLAFRIAVALLAAAYKEGRPTMSGGTLRRRVGHALRAIGTAGIADVIIHGDNEDGDESLKPFVRHENPKQGTKMPNFPGDPDFFGTSPTGTKRSGNRG